MRKISLMLVVGIASVAVAYWLMKVVPPAQVTSEVTRQENQSAKPTSAADDLARPLTELPTKLASVDDSDPRLTYATIYRNIRPDVRYVGDANCAQCHDEICKSFHQHPMGRSAIVAGSDGLETFDAAAKNPFQVGPHTLSVAIEDGVMIHRIQGSSKDGKQFAPMDVPVQVAIGSGTRGRSYLNIDGETVWQSPISWYSTNSRWDISPGFDLGVASQRPIVSECLYCHVNQHDAIDEAVNRFRDPIDAVQLAIGCERCHGPGELHSKERIAETWKEQAEGNIDTSIVNPAHLSDSLQMSICAQCHLSGKERVARRGRSGSEFRPGLPFELFATAFLAHPDAPFKNKAVSHFDQSVQAKCTTASGGKLLCTSCHDPHQVPNEAQADQFYIDQCVACHVQQPCTAPEPLRQQQNDHCLKCHMPKSSSSNIPHTSLTDHRIKRDPNQKEETAAFSVSDIPLILYSNEGLSPAEIDRDLGIALSQFAARQAPASPFRKQSLGNAKIKLEASLQSWPDDSDAWLALSEAEKMNGSLQQSLDAAEKGLRASPNNESLLAQVASAADASGNAERSLQALNALVNLVPTSHDYLNKRMLTSVSMGDWDQAEQDCNELLRVNPTNPTAHLVLAMSLYGNGKQSEGRAELENALLLASTPQQRASIQAWFDRFVAWRSKFD